MSLHFVFIGFLMITRVNGEYFLEQHEPVDFCNADAVSLEVETEFVNIT
jgi:hypothetical protein